MNYNNFVKIWIIIGVVMLFFQIMIGGITRLTGSGLSITKWEVVTGTFPPIGQKSWQKEFDAYKETPQYRLINYDMKMGNMWTAGTFKFIYFWEYLHRLWARAMGFIFIFPFLIFIYLAWIDKPVIKRLGVVIVLAVLAASFGWIMVASGLIQRPWVNAYKLALHLCIGISVYAYLLWSSFYVFKVPRIIEPNIWSKYYKYFTILLVIQIFFGGVMSGMKAGLFFPTWPDMNGAMIPNIVMDLKNWNAYNFNDYDKSGFMSALIQLLHRTVAYLLFFYGVWLSMKSFTFLKKNGKQLLSILFMSFLSCQVLLGIVTLLQCKGSIPVTLGSLHQMTAVVLLSIALYINYSLRISR